MAKLSNAWQQGHAALVAAAAAPDVTTALAILTSQWMKPKRPAPSPPISTNGRPANGGAASTAAVAAAELVVTTAAVGRKWAPAPRAAARSAAQPHARPPVQPAEAIRPATAPVHPPCRSEPAHDPAACTDAPPPAQHARPTPQGRAGGGRAGNGASRGRGRGAIAVGDARPVPATARPVPAAPRRRPEPPTRDLLVPLLPMPWDAPVTQAASGDAPPRAGHTPAAVAGRAGGRGSGRGAVAPGRRPAVHLNAAAHESTQPVVPAAAVLGQGGGLTRATDSVASGADTLEARARSAGGGSAWDAQHAAGAPAGGSRHVRGGGPRGAGGRSMGRLGGRGRG